MSDDSRTSRANAQHCARLAEDTKSPKLKAALAKLAQGWSELAEQQEKAGRRAADRAKGDTEQQEEAERRKADRTM